MCITLIAAAALIGAGATVVNGIEQRNAAKEQAAQVAENARQASMQAAESARGNALAQQTAVDRQNAESAAAANAKLSALDTTAPVVQIAAASTPQEAERRRVVRAQFNPDGQDGGSIRL